MLKCPECGAATRVLSTSTNKDGSVCHRRHECERKHRFSSKQRYEEYEQRIHNPGKKFPDKKRSGRKPIEKFADSGHEESQEDAGESGWSALDAFFRHKKEG